MEGAHVVCPFLTEAYSKSKNCKKELNYTDSLDKDIVPCMAARFKPSGWLGLITAGMLWMDFRYTVNSQYHTPGTPTSPVRILNNCSASFRLFSRLGKITCGLVDVTFMPLSHLSGFIFHSATLYLVTNLACLRNPDNIDNSIASLVKELKEVCEDNLPMKSVDVPRIALRSAATAPEAEKVNSSMV